MPKVNYKYEKRQKDIAKQKKREEKQRRRREKKQQEEGAPPENGAGESGDQEKQDGTES